MQILVLLALALMCLIGMVVCAVIKETSENYARYLLDKTQKAQQQFNAALATIKKPCQGVSVDHLPEEVQIAVLSQATMEDSEWETFIQRLRRPTDDKR
jgi:hypothetical protein